MNRYNVKIDGEISPNSYTYQELEDLGIFEFDEIEIKQTNKQNWTPLTSYYFPEKQDSNIDIDEYGQVHLRTNNGDTPKYKIDEFGQIIRTDHENTSSNNSSQTSTSSSSRNPSNYSSSSDDGWNTFWKVVGTIIVIGICIAIAACTNGYGTPVAAIGAYACKAIWND